MSTPVVHLGTLTLGRTVDLYVGPFTDRFGANLDMSGYNVTARFWAPDDTVIDRDGASGADASDPFIFYSSASGELNTEGEWQVKLIATESAGSRSVEGPKWSILVEADPT